MNFKRLALLSLFCLGAYLTKAQEKVQLTNGKIVEGTILDTLNEQVHISAVTKKGKVYDTYLENYRVFSIIHKDGTEHIIYKQDSTIGNILSQTDMKFHVLGEQDAYLNYKPIGTSVIGAVLSFGLTVFDTYSFKDDATTTVNEKGLFKQAPGFLPILFPFVYTVVAGIAPRPNLDIRDINDKSNLNNENYVQGFARTARFKRSVRALLFSCIGSAIGMGTYAIFK